MATPSVRRLTPSRKRLQPGDVFVMQLPTDDYLFGCVIRTDAAWPLGGGFGAILVYVYAYRSRDKTPPERLDPKDLLIPPRFTNRLGWSRGYFETVEHRSLEAGDVLPRHRFRPLGGGNELLDELGERTLRQGAPGPVGHWGLDSYATIADDVAKTLGLPLSGD